MPMAFFKCKHLCHVPLNIRKIHMCKGVNIFYTHQNQSFPWLISNITCIVNNHKFESEILK